MKVNSIVDLQIWASGFFLTEPLTKEIIDDYSWDDFDQWVWDHRADPFEDYTGPELWELIGHLASYTLTKERYGL